MRGEPPSRLQGEIFGKEGTSPPPLALDWY